MSRPRTSSRWQWPASPTGSLPTGARVTVRPSFAGSSKRRPHQPYDASDQWRAATDLAHDQRGGHRTRAPAGRGGGRASGVGADGRRRRRPDRTGRDDVPGRSCRGWSSRTEPRAGERRLSDADRRLRSRIHPMAWFAPVIGSIFAVLAWAAVAHSSGSGWVQADGRCPCRGAAHRTGRSRLCDPWSRRHLHRLSLRRPGRAELEVTVEANGPIRIVPRAPPGPETPRGIPARIADVAVHASPLLGVACSTRWSSSSRAALRSGSCGGHVRSR